MAISLTYTFTANTTIASAQVNDNFNTLATRALDKTGDTMTGDLKFTDASYDIGKSGATRPRHGYFSGNLVVGGAATLSTPLALTSGGTAASLTASNGGIFYSTASAGAVLAGTATAGQIIRSGASTAPTWSTATYPATAGTALNVLTSDGTNWSSVAPGAPFVRLGGTSGTDTTSSATNVFTLALASGLTSLDTLVVVLTHTSATQNTGVPLIYNSTDSVTIQSTNSGSALTAGIFGAETLVIRQDQSATTAVVSSGITFNTGGTPAGSGTKSTFTTAWTGAWTLALRHGGVTAGGTYKWNIAVYKLAGQ